MISEDEELRIAMAYIDHQIQKEFLSRTSKMEFLAQKRIMERILEERQSNNDELFS